MRSLMTLSLLLPVLAFAGCASSSDGPHDLPRSIVRIDTAPAGAALVIHRHDLILTTPADVGVPLDAHDEISVTKEGYIPFHGTLADVPQIALGTYHVRLHPRP